MLRWLILVLAVTASEIFAQDAHTIIEQSVAATNRDWNAAPNYAFSQRVRANGGTKTSDVMMIEGSPYSQLKAVNNNPLTAQQEAEEQKKLEQAIVQRRNESPEEKSRRIAQYVKERNRDHLFMEQLTQAFDFTLEGEQKLGGRDVYVLSARPRPGYHPPNMEAQVLTGMQGRLWVDRKTFQWVRVEAVVIHPVNIEGFVARVEPGTRFELENMPVDDDIWLAKHFAMRSRSKIVLLVPHKTQEEETYWGYRKSTSEKDR